TTLYIRGRDVDEQEKALTFNKENCRWTILGEAEEVHRSETRRKIVTALNEASLPMGPKDIAAQSDISETLPKKTLSRMLKEGEIIKVSRGEYISAGRTDLLPVEPVTSVTVTFGPQKVTGDRSDALFNSLSLSPQQQRPERECVWRYSRGSSRLSK